MSKYTRRLDYTNIEMYSLMRNKKKENIYDGWFDDKIEYWFANKGINFMRVDELVGFL